MFKNSLLNADKDTKDEFLKQAKAVIKSIIKENKLDLQIKDLEYFDNKALYQFTIPTKSKSQRAVYTILLQTMRIVGLLHDVGHLPFSHQVEHALKKVYIKILEKNTLLEKEKEFKRLYEDITNNSTLVLHEAIGKKLLDLLFDFELTKLVKKSSNKDYIQLLKIVAKYILEDKNYNGFDFAVLHKYIDGTVDSDRLDYINRDMLSSGYITGPIDHIRITKQTILVKKYDKFVLSFLDMSLIDIEHMLELRFNLYKKVIYNHGIAKTDAVLENVVQYLSDNFFNSNEEIVKLSYSISMLWKFFEDENISKRLDIVSLLDENWLISLFKDEYFKIKNNKNLTRRDQKYLYCFEEVLFGKRVFSSPWKNLNEFYKVLDFTTVERYKFRESFGYITDFRMKKLQKALDCFVNKWEVEKKEAFLTYKIVSFSLGIEKDFCFYDGDELVNIDEVSTLRKRLKHSMRNTVPFYIYINKKYLNKQMKEELKSILFNIFSE
jgi:hypothetical protein